jgi:hypothetical protein
MVRNENPVNRTKNRARGLNARQYESVPEAPLPLYSGGEGWGGGGGFPEDSRPSPPTPLP